MTADSAVTGAGPTGAPPGNPRRLGTQVVVALLAGLLGFAVVAAVRPTTPEQDLSTARESDLVALLDDLGQRQQRLEQQRIRLQDSEQRLLGADDAERLAEARRRADRLAVLAGTAPATAAGITMTITDPAGRIGSAVVLSAVQELRNAGAYAMSIGPQRVVVDTWFGDGPRPGQLIVSGHVVPAPYQFRVLGDPDTLATALRIPGGVADTVGAEGGSVRVVDDRPVTITAVVPLAVPRFAQPLPSPS